MLFAFVRELSTILFLSAAVNCLNDNSQYYEIENKEKKTEYDSPSSATLPEAESYVIGVKRALLPFRQLSKYLRRPVNDPRSGNSFAGIQWKTPQQETPEIVVKTQNQKRWYRGETGMLDRETNCPEIILIRPINISQIGDSKISNINKEVDDAIKTRQRQDKSGKVSDGSEKVQPIRNAPSTPLNSKKLKIDNQIFQGNGINIKLTFSVDVGNQSKALDSNKSTTNKSLKKTVKTLNINRSRQ